MTKSRVLDALGRKDEATTARNKALTMANAIQLHGYGRQLQIDGKQSEAFAIFRDNAKKNPDAWIVHVGLVAHVLRPGRLRQRSQGNERGGRRRSRRAKAAVAGLRQALGGEGGY